MQEIFKCVSEGYLSYSEAFDLPVHRRQWWMKLSDKMKGNRQAQQEEAQMSGRQQDRQGRVR